MQIMDIIPGLQPGRVELLKGFRTILSKDISTHHNKDICHLSVHHNTTLVRGREKKWSAKSMVKGWERHVFYQTSIGAFLRAALGKYTRD